MYVPIQNMRCCVSAIARKFDESRAPRKNHGAYPESIGVPTMTHRLRLNTFGPVPVPLCCMTGIAADDYGTCSMACSARHRDRRAGIDALRILCWRKIKRRRDRNA
jgi:hypothetical protein